MIDLRSDTFTKPCLKMKEFMFDALVGDDVYGEDPSVNFLQDKMSKLAGKEDALFVSSGTQANLLSIFSHCSRGDEYICGNESHIYKYEGGGAAVLASVQSQTIEFEEDGSLNLDKIRKSIKVKDDHFARTKLICLENTHNGKVLSIKYLEELSFFAKENDLLLHLDGARLFNASVYLDLEIKEICKYFDSISICFSKGLGAPIGSILLGNKTFIKEAKKYRKMLGGGLRQAGYLAAACTYSLDNNIEDLKIDHEHIKILREELSKIEEVNIVSSDTNMLFLEAKNEDELVKYLKDNNIMISGYGQLRLVTHRDISSNDIKEVITKFKEFYKN
ncbi:MAG: low-specificity L-threonine aldolase [Campylobacteraceae bacterium]|nr:low-specificity L-threonine aldolase [Campylobacteraceae bacterium]